MSTYNGKSLQDLVDTFRSNKAGASVPTSARQKYAQSMGYRTSNNQAIGDLGGHPTYTPLNNFTPPQYRTGSQQGVEDSLLGAFQRDANVLQSAADEQYKRMNQQIGGMSQALKGGLAGIQQGSQVALGEANQAIGGLQNSQDLAVNNLMGQAQGLQGMIPGTMQQVWNPINQAGQAAGAMSQQAQQFLNNPPDLQSDARAAFERGQQEYGAYGQAIEEYKKGSWADAESIASGIRSSMADQAAIALSSTNPDGTPKTPAQMAADRYQFGRMAQEQVSSVMSQTAGKVNDMVANMRTTMANMGFQVANLRGAIGDAKQREAELKLSGLQVLGQSASMLNEVGKTAQGAASLEADIRSRSAEIAAQAEQSRLAYQQLQSSWHEYRANVLNNTPLTSLQLEMQGRGQIAQFVQQNPQTEVSWFESLLGLYSALSAARGSTGMGGGGGGGGVATSRGGQKPTTGQGPQRQTYQHGQGMNGYGGGQAPQNQMGPNPGGPNAQPGVLPSGYQIPNEANGAAVSRDYSTMWNPNTMGPPSPGATNYGWPR